MTDEPDGYKAILICKGCGVEAEFYVRWRGRNEPIERYVEDVIRPGMTGAHQLASPLCISKEADLKLPINEAADGIGKRVTN